MIETELLIKSEDIAKKAWEAHELSQPATMAQEVKVLLLAEELVDGLKHNFGPSQPEPGVFLDKQSGHVGITVNPKASWDFCHSGGIQQVIFESTDHYGDKNSRRLLLRGNHPEDSNRSWETEFIIGGSQAIKRDNRVALLFEQADARLVTSILGGIRDQIEGLKFNKRR